LKAEPKFLSDGNEEIYLGKEDSGAAWDRRARGPRRSGPGPLMRGLGSL